MDRIKVEPLTTLTGKTRYILVNELGEPLQPVLRFLRFKDNNDAARNTLRSNCYHLKLFFEFLEQRNLDYRDVGIDDMALFVGWLQNPYGNMKVSPITPLSPSRKPATVNTVINTVVGFYDYLMRHEDYSIQLSERLKKQISGARRGYKDFLYHISKDKFFSSNILKVKTPKNKPKTLSKKEISSLIETCSNVRDKFLVFLLWESSIRIGEALSLWIEDFEVDACRIHIEDRGELPNLAEIKTVNSPRAIDISSDLMNMFMDYIAEYHSDEVDSNHVFIKITGSDKNQPMEYQDIVSLFNRLKKKTGIYATPHMLRHSSLTELSRSGWKAETLRVRSGHKNVSTLMQMYIHPSDEEMRVQWENAERNMKLAKQKKEDQD